MLNNPFELVQLLSNSNNPMGVLMQLAGNNYHLQQVMKIAQNKTPEEFKSYVQNICKTNNIDINSLAKQFNLPL